MKKTILILTLLLSTLLVAQKQRTNTFKIKKQQPEICIVAIDSNYWDETTSKEELLKAGKIELVGNFGDSIRIIGFSLSLGVNGTFWDLISVNDSLTTQMRTKLMMAEDGSYIIIKNIECQTKSGKKEASKGLALKIDSKHKTINKKLHYPILLACLSGYSIDSIPKSELLRIGKIELQSDLSDSSKIIGFTINIPQNGIFIPYSSPNEYLTKEMIEHILTMPNGAYVEFRNIRCRLSNGKIKLLKNLDIQVF
jgi:hypothetical protein